MSPLFIYRAVCIASLCAAAAGCNHNPAKPDAPVLVDSKKTVEIDRRLLEECPDLPKLKDATDETSVKVTKEWLNAYSACRTNKSKLNVIVKDAFNLKEKK